MKTIETVFVIIFWLWILFNPISLQIWSFLFSPIRKAFQVAEIKRKDQECEHRKKRDEEESRIRWAESEKNNLIYLVTNSEAEFIKLPNLIGNAEFHLDKAEEEFSDGVFAPFWDEIEHATNSLAAYHQNINYLISTAQDYDKRAKQLPSKVPAFSLPLHKLPDARPTAQRLAKIVRKAQKDFHFATIYEQRKTNQLLYQGFRSLGEAIYSMGDQISYSLDGLSDRLNVSLNDLLDSSREQTRILNEQDEKLDNIQRRRKPPY